MQGKLQACVTRLVHDVCREMDSSSLRTCDHPLVEAIIIVVGYDNYAHPIVETN